MRLTRASGREDLARGAAGEELGILLEAAPGRRWVLAEGDARQKVGSCSVRREAGDVGLARAAREMEVEEGKLGFGTWWRE
jgi:hypothetical protein